MSDHESRRKQIDKTLIHATNHRLLWSLTDDELVLSRRPQGFHNDLNDFGIAMYIGRTIVAVSQRRVILHRLLDHGMTLEEIHDVERLRRAERNNISYRIIHNQLQAACSECFCSPHSPDCSKEGS